MELKELTNNQKRRDFLEDYTGSRNKVFGNRKACYNAIYACR